MAQITLVEVEHLSATLKSADNDCEACASGMPGVLAPCLPDSDASHAFIQKCDLCEVIEDDDAATEAFAMATGLIAHRRFDDDSLTRWRPFVARAGDEDDTDLVCVWTAGPQNEFGVHPDDERPLDTPESQHAQVQ